MVNVIRTLVRFRLPIMRIRLDKKAPEQVDSMLAVVANTPNFGSVFLVAPEARLDNGRLDVALYAGFSKADILAYFAEVTDGRSAGSGRVQRYQARKIKIKAKPTQLVMADNQRLGKGAIKIRILPRALRVIAPEYAGAPGRPVDEERSGKPPKVVAPQTRTLARGKNTMRQAKNGPAHLCTEGKAAAHERPRTLQPAGTSTILKNAP